MVEYRDSGDDVSGVYIGRLSNEYFVGLSPNLHAMRPRRRTIVFKKKERTSPLWFVPKEELGPYREEFLEHGYTYMVTKYRISR